MFSLASIIMSLYMSIDTGANDVGQSMGIAYGSGALSMRRVLVIAAVLGLLGSATLGWLVIETVGTKITTISLSGVFIITLAANIWLTLVLWKRLPISVTQSAIGALLGWSFAAGGSVDAGVMGDIALSWVVSPVLAILSGFALATFLREIARPRSIAEYDRWESSMLKWQLLPASLLAFSNGANNIGISMGFLMPIVGNAVVLGIGGGVAMAVGVLVAGKRIIKTVGRGITSLTPLTGFAAQLSTSAVILGFTLLGVPISGTYVLVGSIIGATFAGGALTLRWKTISQITLSWIFTVPATAGISFLIATLII